MNRTQIEWCDYTINPVRGLCPVGCEYCYARRMYKRFGWNPEIRYIPPGFSFAEIKSIRKPSRIFVGSTIELFGPWVADLWLKDTFEIVRQFPQHTFIFLTKRPWELSKWNPWPDNAWVGASVCNDNMLNVAVDKLEDTQAKVKFISFEPLLEKQTFSLRYAFYYSGIAWLIIGQQTPISKRTAPRKEWIQEIVEAADRIGVSVFLKNNLYPLLFDSARNDERLWRPDGRLRQEWPKLKESE